MKSQLGLPFQAHSETSRLAAISMLEAAETQRGRLYRWLRDYGPATDEQIADALGLNPSAARPRRIELERLGVVRDSGLRMETLSGRKAVVWEVAA